MMYNNICSTRNYMMPCITMYNGLYNYTVISDNGIPTTQQGIVPAAFLLWMPLVSAGPATPPSRTNSHSRPRCPLEPVKWGIQTSNLCEIPYKIVG